MSDQEPADQPTAEPAPPPAAAPPPAKKRLDLGTVLTAVVVIGFFAENAAMMWFYQPWAHGMPSPADIAKAEMAAKADGHGGGNDGHGDDAGEAKPKRRRGPVALYDLAPLLVNLADSNAHRYAKAQISLGFHEATILEELAEDKVLVAAARQTVSEALASRHAAELVTPEGKGQLRQELLAKLNELPFSAEVTDIYITEFLVQF